MLYYCVTLRTGLLRWFFSFNTEFFQLNFLLSCQNWQTFFLPSTPVLKNNTQIAKASRAVLYSNLNTTLRKSNRSYRLQTVHKTDMYWSTRLTVLTVYIGHSDSNWTKIGAVQNIACPKDIITGDDINWLLI